MRSHTPRRQVLQCILSGHKRLPREIIHRQCYAYDGNSILSCWEQWERQNTWVWDHMCDNKHYNFLIASVLQFINDSNGCKLRRLLTLWYEMRFGVPTLIRNSWDFYKIHADWLTWALQHDKMPSVLDGIATKRCNLVADLTIRMMFTVWILIQIHCNSTDTLSKFNLITLNNQNN